MSGCTSTSTGFAPRSTIISTVATKVNGQVITSSPGLMSSAISAIRSASVPLAHATAVLRADVRRQALLELGDLGAEDVLPVVEHLLDAGVDRRFERLVLRLEVDEVHGQLRRGHRTTYNRRSI